ncbi:54S ribosomal protein yml6, mitochondrial [Sorochytrium milnesiophthora]
MLRSLYASAAAALSSTRSHLSTSAHVCAAVSSTKKSAEQLLAPRVPDKHRQHQQQQQQSKAAPQPIEPELLAWLRDFQSHAPLQMMPVSSTVFGQRVRTDILQRCVVWQRDAMRQGTHESKGRSDVRGSSRKIANQKGRGKARAGSIRAPQFRGGGIVHGPHNRDHSTFLPLKVREMGLRSALSAKYAQKALLFTQPLPTLLPAECKTKHMASVLNQHYPPLTLEGITCSEKQDGRKFSSILIVGGVDECEPTVARAVANIPDVTVMSAKQITVYDILKHEYLVLDEMAKHWLEWRLSL